MVQLMEFENLQLLYRVNAADYGIRYLAFSADNMRFLDVRGTQCNIWELPVLSGLAKRDEASTEPAAYEPVIKGISDGELEITSIEIDNAGQFFFVGKSDGTVSVYDTSSGTMRRVLYRHTYQISVTSISWGGQRKVIATADTACRFIICVLKLDVSTGMAVAGKLMDLRADSSVRQIMLNPSNDLLLVSTEESNTVWNLKTKEVMTTRTWQPSPSYQWINHPTSAELRILVTINAATIMEWKTSNRVTSATLLPAVNDDPITQGVKNAFVFSEDGFLAVELSELYGERSTTQTLIFMLADSADPFLTPLIDHHSISKEIVHLIGAHGSKLLFLDKNRWVCSVDVTTIDLKFYVRHFPIPADWQSQQRWLRMGITSLGDVLFVRVDEVAVISRGLEFEEEVELDCA